MAALRDLIHGAKEGRLGEVQELEHGLAVSLGIA